MSKKLTTEEFINKCVDVHGDHYDYSSVIYKGVDEKIDIICPSHGKFTQTGYHHLAGHGCKRCSCKKSKKTRQISIEQFIARSNLIHNNFYDYSNVDFENVKEKVKIICPTHGEFIQSVDSHQRGSKCPKCSVNEIKKSQSFTLNEVIKKASKIHNNRYDYSSVNFINTKTKVDIICPKHGIFSQNMSNHFLGKGCPKCKCFSNGEKAISNFLITNDISHTYQKKFDNFRNPKTKRCYIFDFFLEDLNVIIEYDGIQHFQPVDYFGGENAYMRNIEVDNIKNKWCEDNKISIIRLSNLETIDQKLSSFLLPLMPSLVDSPLSNSQN